MPGRADLLERYLVLSLRLGRHIDGFVDFYYGPPELAGQVKGEESTAPVALADEARELARSVGGLGDPPRERWLAAQLEGLAAVAERLDGRPVSYAEEVRRCFGVDLDPATEAELAAAHRRLDELVPGTGLLGERYRAWRRQREVPRDAILPAAEALAAELRRRTDELFGLPEGEATEIELVSHEPWTAFNYYLGGRRSRVVANTDVPLRAEELPELVAHELYPGHNACSCRPSVVVKGEHSSDPRSARIGHVVGGRARRGDAMAQSPVGTAGRRAAATARRKRQGGA